MAGLSFEAHPSLTQAVESCVRVNTSGRDIQFILRDTPPGLEKYHSIPVFYYRDAVWILILFPLDDSVALLNVRQWMEEALKIAPTAKPFLIGTKSDLEHKVTYEQAHIVMCQLSIDSYLETSAKGGENVDVLLSQLARDLPEPNPSPRHESVSPEKSSPQQRSCSC
eukprot:TRINITY_DN3983_c0_g1_i1.p1 TRINITY_DN3983_c0_g1~~TRINITY_DN3983_c0_g1_i1.p1  ORF type:complete len:167 (-),score=23.67 TRINITY_DN3983_c0_g1_i1:90-590(-)